MGGWTGPGCSGGVVTFVLWGVLSSVSAVVRADDSVARPPVSTRADEGSAALRELESSSDFRVRVTAALLVGRARPPGSREALERALNDAHSAVRAAAAAALGTLGDPQALPALRRRLPADPSASVQAQIKATMDRLTSAQAADEGPADAASETRFVVRLGTMRNRTGVRGDEVRQVLLESAKARARALRGAVVVDADSAPPHATGPRRVPVIALDGSVMQLVESRVGGVFQVQARVEFTLRHDQSLKGTLSGAATTLGSGAAMSDQARKELEDTAIDAAVQSALRGAEQGLIVAAR
ncbi:MAG TPA: HEAT repeat domain-containing protein [Polyangiaceae bacterium]|nr:HEAT repeat domain-containing protein [Polyangiaceae bacterium]